MGDKLSRRGFVGAAAGTAAATALGPFAPAASARHRHRRHGHQHDGGRLLPRERIGIQLYTVRDQVDALGFDEVFRRLSAFGYKEVEFAGYNAQGRRWSNQELRGLLRKYGLTAAGSHVSYTSPSYSFRATLEQVLDDAEEIGMKYVGTASSPAEGTSQTPDGFRQAAAEFNEFGAAARKRGLRFYQHNHFSEFEVVDGTRLYDVLLEETDPKLVFFEMDIFWAYVGQSLYPGFKPHEYPWNQPERFPLFHVKDGRRDGGPHEEWTMTDVGAGDIAFEPFFCGLDTSEHHFIVENDDAAQSAGGSFGFAERSYDYLASLRARRR